MKLNDLLKLIKFGSEWLVIIDEYGHSNKYNAIVVPNKYNALVVPNKLKNKYVSELGTTHGGNIYIQLSETDSNRNSHDQYQKSDIRRLNELATATIINGRLTKFRYYSDDVHSKDNQLHWKSVTNEEVTKDDLFYLNQLGNLLQVDGDRITLINWEY